MTNEQIKTFALELLRADSEEEVISILKRADYWDNPDVWRLYGDKEGNWSQAGNQQSFPEASLVEKVINSVDTRLMLKCLLRDIYPEGKDAPTSIRDVVAMFFEDRKAENDEAGTIINWPQTRRREESKAITISATGGKPTRGKRTKKMCLTIADQGEGQSANRLPETILSLNAKNKQRIRFVQGKFNMGGSGALRFCGDNGFQVVISRRHRTLAQRERAQDDSVDKWSVTVVRREDPSDDSGTVVHSEFTYLAPIGANESPREGGVLRFDSETMPIMPRHDDAYVREVEHGTAIKLIEYATKTGQSTILQKDGLLYALERLMPQIALPIRLHECRGYQGVKEKSFETSLSGLVVRLEDGKGDNLEPGFPKSAPIFASGTKMTAKIYAFKEDKAATYLDDEGVIFQINGQAHGYLKKSIFSRPEKVGLGRLRDSLLVFVDCSDLSTRKREDLFMTSRDRLSDNAIKREIEKELMIWLKTEPSLRRLQQERRNRDVEDKLKEEKPLEEVLGKVMKASPTLRTLFLAGQRLSRPFAGSNKGAGGAGTGTGGGSKKNNDKKDFIGNRHPTKFDIAAPTINGRLQKTCEIGRRCRVKFDTDVENAYFDRATDKGTYDIEILNDEKFSVPNANFSLDDGDAFLSLSLPPEAEVGDQFTIKTRVSDPTLVQPFINLIRLTVVPKTVKKKSKQKKKVKGGSGSGDLGSSQGISLPEVVSVKEDDNNWARYKFNSYTACHVVSESTPVDGQDVVEHTFYINISNTSLLTEMKYRNVDPRILEAKFKYGNVLLGLAMLHDAEISAKDKEPADEIAKVTRAVAPVLLPMIDQLSGIDDVEISSMFDGD